MGQPSLSARLMMMVLTEGYRAGFNDVVASKSDISVQESIITVQGSLGHLAVPITISTPA